MTRSLYSLIALDLDGTLMALDLKLLKNAASLLRLPQAAVHFRLAPLRKSWISVCHSSVIRED
jgi:hypothetical protein